MVFFLESQNFANFASSLIYYPQFPLWFHNPFNPWFRVPNFYFPI